MFGRTIHPEQRLKEHQYGARNYKEGDEDKYAYASALDALRYCVVDARTTGMSVHTRITSRITTSTCSGIIGEVLMNMKAR